MEVEVEEWRVSREGEGVTCGLDGGAARELDSFGTGRAVVEEAVGRAWAAAEGLVARNCSKHRPNKTNQLKGVPGKLISII